MCFCPLSAIAANQTPRFGPRSHDRIRGLSPLLKRRYSPASSSRCVYMRIVSGGFPAITNTHDSQT